MQNLAYSGTYKNYPTFMEITNDEISELVNKCVAYIDRKLKEKAELALQIPGILNEIRN